MAGRRSASGTCWSVAPVPVPAVWVGDPRMAAGEDPNREHGGWVRPHRQRRLVRWAEALRERLGLPGSARWESVQRHHGRGGSESAPQRREPRSDGVRRGEEDEGVDQA